MTVNHPTQAPGSGACETVQLASDAAGTAEAGRLLAQGALVAFPTETVYGLGADATNPVAVAALYAAKGRPAFNPLIAHVGSVAEALKLGRFSPLARKLAEAFWPGPLTLVVPLAADGPVCELARAGLQSLAIRVPDHPIAKAILDAAGRPIAAPSANRSGHVSPSTAAHVRSDLEGRIAAILDGGPTSVGVESTILAVLDDEVAMLRPGGLARDAIEAVLGRPLAEGRDAGSAPLAPGRLASHYAPDHALRLNATRIAPGEACLAFGPVVPKGADPALTINLSQTGDLAEAAANLYASLRALDALPSNGMAAASVPRHGLGEALNDRLQRAAAPRVVI
ncbi:MAG: threonylcarbamoyl-AMP synthase [Proteobacteria bacterium]|nr:threonylcarbamoyl-AMP synthase [Pseudomonadota bacterium]